MCILCSCKKCLSSMCLFRIPSMFSCRIFKFWQLFLGVFVFCTDCLGLFGGDARGLFVLDCKKGV